MASSEYSPQKRPASNEQASPPIQGYSDDEARDIYARAADIQSRTAFDDDKLTPEMLQRSANRAGISDAAVQQAIREREQERVATLASEKQRAVQNTQLKRQLLLVGVGLSLVTGGTLMVANNAMGSRLAAVQSAQSQVENVLERRHNLIPNLISVTQATLKNQRALIDNLRAASDATQSATSPDAKNAAETQLGSAVSQTLSALRSGAGGSSPIVTRLSDEMAGSENRIAVERRKYNQAVEAYNSRANSFPIGVAGRLLGYKAHLEGFKASAEAMQTPKFE